MLNSILIGAAMLLAGQTVPAANFPVEPQVTMAPVAKLEMKMTAATLTVLIEDHAAPHWNLSKEHAWELYNDGVLKIQEIEAEHYYHITYDGGLLEAILEGSDN